MPTKLAGHRNFFLFLVFALGVICAHYLSLNLAFLFVSLISLALTHFFFKKNKLFLSDTFLLAFFFSLGLSWATPTFYHRVDKFLGKESEVSLKVVSLPKEYHLKNTFFAQIKEIDNLPVNFKVRVSDFTKKMDYLNSYRAFAKLTKKFYQDRYFYTLWVKSKAPLDELPLSIGDKFNKKSVNLILAVFKNNLSAEAYRFLASVFLGRRELLKGEGKDFSLVGASHLLAISGLHIGLTSLILFFILRLFGIKFRMSLFVSIIFLCLYTFLTGASPSTLRAAIMYSLFAFGFFMKKKNNSLNSLGLAGFISLIINPLAIFDVGFQLSYTCVLAIILGFKMFPLKFSQNFILRYLEYTFFTSFFVTLFISPLVSYYFGRIYLLSIIYNLILIPFFTFILIINFIFLIAFPLHFIAQSLGAFLSLSIFLFNYLIRLFGSINFAYFSYSFSPGKIVVYYLLLAAIFIVFRYKMPAKLTKNA